MILLLALAAAAQTNSRDGIERRYTPACNRCMEGPEASAGVNPAMLQCLYAENERQDAALNREYERAMKTLPQRRCEALRRAERGWIVHRDRTCLEGEEAGIGAGAAALNQAGCLVEATIVRTMTLETIQ